MLKIDKPGGTLFLEADNVWTLFEDDYDSYYVIKIFGRDGEKYFFSTRTFVKSLDLARKFNTIRSARRSIKLIGDVACRIEKIKRNNF